MVNLKRSMIAIHVAVAALVLPALASGDGADDDGSVQAAEADLDPGGAALVITAADLDELAPDQRLILDRRWDTRVIVLDPGLDQDDLSQIEVVLADGRAMTLGAWLAAHGPGTTLHGPIVLAPPSRLMNWSDDGGGGNNKPPPDWPWPSQSSVADASGEVDAGAACSASQGTSPGAGPAGLFFALFAAILVRRRRARRHDVRP
ncbi:MAG: hypothetical protein IT372_40830 [Polyangiaceae bacterium]|nr:hypothetical protein [Polyangiaceae bacterium]